MKFYRFLQILIAVFLSALFIQSTAFAEEEKERCIKPKFRSFDPPNHAVVAPGSEISFHVKNAEKSKIKVAVKKIPIELTIEDRSLFLIVKGKLPDSLVDTYARVSLSATAELGCKSKDGWLLKITGGSEAEETEASTEAEQATPEEPTTEQ